MRRLTSLPLYLQIGIGLLLGLLWGLASAYLQLDISLTSQFIKPLGEIFVRLLKMVAVPLVLASLVLGIASLNDVNKLSRMGGKTMFIYLFTTITAISLGLGLVNLLAGAIGHLPAR